jgi:hypothetical protein
LLTGHAWRLTWLATIIPACLLTLAFVYAASRNLDAIGDGHRRYTPGQSVGWLLIPLVNLYMAHQVLTSLWRESQPRPRYARRSVDFSVIPVNVWFGLMLGAVFVGNLLADMRLGGAAASTVLSALRMAQGIAYIVVVMGIAARQREQWRDLEQRRAVPEPKADLR